MKIQFLGATETVTGSKFHLTENNHSWLIECGLFQALKDNITHAKTIFLKRHTRRFKMKKDEQTYWNTESPAFNRYFGILARA